jgi:FkbM family methyltransferase
MAAGYVRDLIYDVGMHQGEDTEFYLKKGFRVIAFEANADLAAAARTKFADYIANGRLVIVEGAIVDASYSGDTVEFYKNNKNTLWGTVSPYFAERNVSFGAESTVIRVPRINFADCLAKLGIPYYLKIDMEGMDTVCLRALLQVEGRPAYVSKSPTRPILKRLRKSSKYSIGWGIQAFKPFSRQRCIGRSSQSLLKKGSRLNTYLQGEPQGYLGKTFRNNGSLLIRLEDNTRKYLSIIKFGAKISGLLRNSFR